MSDKEYEIIDVQPEFDKLPISEIMDNADTVKPKKAANEVLKWVTDNVENFIDNQQHEFELDLVLDTSEEFNEIKKLQDLYRAIPDDEMFLAPETVKALQGRARALMRLMIQSFLS